MLPLIPQATFIKGELSPLFHSRIDLELYRQGLALCENWLVLPQGGIRTRPGTKFVAEVKDSSKKVRLVRFVYSTEMSYVLEFGDLYIRFYKEQGQIRVDGVPVELVTTYTAAELSDLHFAQTNDTLYIVHKDHVPAVLTRSSHTAWTLSSLTFTAQPADWTAGNYPRRIAFYENRLVLAATPAKPTTAWLGKTKSETVTIYTNFTTGTDDDSAIIVTVRTGDVNAIQWMAEDKQLQFGTTSATRTIGGAGDEPLTPTSISQVRHTTDGSAAIQPIQAGSSTIFVSALRRRVREFVYSYVNDRFLAPDLTMLSEHILKSGVTALAYCQDPFPIVWFALENGELVGCTYDPDFKIAGWHRHRLGGTAGSGWGEVESIASIPGTSHDELWLAVKRTIGGATKRYIEFLTQPFDSEIMAKEDAFQVDCGLSYGGAAADTFSGLGHLEGQTAAIFAGGAIDPQQEVVGGSITLHGGRTAAKASVGLPFTCTARTLRTAGADEQGSLLGRQVRVSGLIVDMLDSLLLRAGTSLNELYPVVLRGGLDPMDSAPPLFTGAKRVTVNDNWENGGQVYVVQDAPAPATVRSLTPVAA